MQTFATLDGRVVELGDDQKESWGWILAPAKVELLPPEKIRDYGKILLDDTPWFELERVMVQRKIKSVFGVRHDDTQQILVVDILVNKEETDRFVHKQMLLKSLARCLKESDSVVEFSSAKLEDLAILQRVRHPEAVRGVILWDNNIADISDLHRFSSVTELLLCENRILTLGSLGELPHLRSLSLQRNCLGGELSELRCPSLEMLNVSFNQLESIASLGRFPYGCLRTLFLSHNQVRALPVLDCPQLETLDFSNNVVSDLSPITVSGLTKLETLNGCHNRIASVPLLKLPLLRVLSLSENAISGRLPLFRLPGLETLLLSGNQIGELTGLQQWQVPKLRRLDLS